MMHFVNDISDKKEIVRAQINQHSSTKKDTLPQSNVAVTLMDGPVL